MNIKSLLLLSASLLISSVGWASECAKLYPKKPIMVPNTIELCNSFYVTIYDPSRRGAIFSSARVSVGSPKITRINAFRPNKLLQQPARADNLDYVGTSFDRGHLTPAGDADTEEEMRDTFLLSNMVPQYPSFNRVQWRQLEMKVRKNLGRETVIITGAIYPILPATIGKHEIPVPTGMYKIVYSVPKAKIYYSENSISPKVVELTFDKLTELTGIDFNAK